MNILHLLWCAPVCCRLNARNNNNAAITRTSALAANESGRCFTTTPTNSVLTPLNLSHLSWSISFNSTQCANDTINIYSHYIHLATDKIPDKNLFIYDWESHWKMSVCWNKKRGRISALKKKNIFPDRKIHVAYKIHVVSAILLWSFCSNCSIENEISMNPTRVQISIIFL